MKKFALIAAVAFSSTAFAEEGAVPPAPEAAKTEAVTVQQSEATVYSPVQSTYNRPVVRRSSRNDTFFGRMMELERRKNAWLRRTFLNR